MLHIFHQGMFYYISKHNQLTMSKIPTVPGRGLNSKAAQELRKDHLKKNKIEIDSLESYSFETSSIQNNIESLIGSIEVPVGLVGPLLFSNQENDHSEFVYTAAATTEGALIASMNRGAKAVSESGGFSAAVLHQKMTRVPLFVFDSLKETIQFAHWIEANFNRIKEVSSRYSNHANLTEITHTITGNKIHCRFVYTTGDASGQNMTTSCTWHAILWIVQTFQEETEIQIKHFVIEGNGSSDKKPSYISLIAGRGVHVVAECELTEEVIKRVLRSSSDEFIRFYTSSLAASNINGMFGYNINCANAIASIYAATGQDLGSLHESSTGILSLEKTDKGLYLSLSLPSLVIGTIGGGTHLPAQQEVLKMMNCAGTGKIDRFAKLIAGFALGLEISTYAAIISGEFAKAHEKLGRNKPVNWLSKSEFDKELIKNSLLQEYLEWQPEKISTSDLLATDNGILTNITQRINKKITGFIPVTLKNPRTNEIKNVVVKSKPTDLETIKGLHIMAASVDPKLSDLIFNNRQNLEYWNCHIREHIMYEFLKKINFNNTPNYYGSANIIEREAFLLILEEINMSNITPINTNWTKEQIQSAIKGISRLHKTTIGKNQEIPETLIPFDASSSIDLYTKLLHTSLQDDSPLWQKEGIKMLLQFVPQKASNFLLYKSITHNDFNPRNLFIDKYNKAIIFDWELATINYPQRDIAELLSFTLEDNFSKEQLLDFIHFHKEQVDPLEKIPIDEWQQNFVYSVKEFAYTRVAFYLVLNIIVKYNFVEKVFANCLKMINFLEED
ncbi:MAG: hypothetical protein C0594_08710 [Marinilabiliales bacterium]|nr:MAG: hypothetical protein C0594_08710 [Marinilabiliales bacterium]